MQVHSRLRLFSIPCVLLASAMAFAQSPGSADGYILDENNKPLMGATITYENAETKAHFEGKSDKSGHFLVSGMPSGNYLWAVTVDGVIRQRDRERISPGLGSTPSVNIKLQSLEAAMAAAAKAAPAASGGGEDDKKAAAAKEAAEKARKELMDAFNAGKTAFDAKQYGVAIDNLTKASVVDPKQYVIWSMLGESYFKRSQERGNPDKAGDQAKGVEGFNKAIELKPTEAGLYNNYALALALAGKFDESRANILKAVEMNPGEASTYYYNLGASLLNAGQSDPAIEAFKKALEAKPDSAEVNFQYGMALAGKATADASGKFSAPPGMVEALQKYLSLEPSGAHSQDAKDMITMMGGTLQTSYRDPNAKAPAKKK